MGEFPNRETQIQPGEVRNPEGRNQYATRREAERIFDELVTRADEGDPSRSVAEVILGGLIELAKQPTAANRWAVQMVVDRLLPKIEGRELSDPQGGVLTIRWANDADEVVKETQIPRVSTFADLARRGSGESRG